MNRCKSNSKRLVFLISGLVAGHLSAAESPALAPPVWDSGWQFGVTPYVWALGLEGDVAVRGIDAPIDVSFGELVKDLKGGLMLELEVRKDRVGFFVDGLLAKIEATGTVGPLPTDLTLDMVTSRFSVDYRFGPFPLGAATNAPTVTVDPYVGGRYTYLKTQIKVGSLPTASGSDYWLDPLVGVRTVWDINRRWNFSVGGNVGGFDVNSRLAWEALGAVGYRFFWTDGMKTTGNVMLGYRAVYQDYSTGYGATYFRCDTTMKGPFIGLGIGF